MPTNWERIKREYVYGDESFSELSDRNGVSYSTLRKHASVENWKSERAKYRTKVEQNSTEIAIKKTADAEADIVAAKSRIRLNIISQIEKRLNIDDMDTADFRRLVQCYKDMEEIDTNRNEASESEAFESILKFVGGESE